MMKPSKWIDIYDQIDKKITVVIIGRGEDKKFNDILVQETKRKVKTFRSNQQNRSSSNV